MSGGKKPTQQQINAAKVARQLVQTNSQGQIVQQQIRPRLVTTTAQPRQQLIKPQHSQADLIKYYELAAALLTPRSSVFEGVRQVGKLPKTKHIYKN